MMAFDGNEASLTLKSNQPGCVTVGDDMTGDPHTEPASAHEEHWIGVGMVSVERAVLRPRLGASGYLRLTSHIASCDDSGAQAGLGTGNLSVPARRKGGERPVTGWLRHPTLRPVILRS
jgi:hypothetical protein